MNLTVLQALDWRVIYFDFVTGFLANCCAGLIILGFTVLLVNVWIGRRDAQAARLLQQKDDERNKWMMLIEHLGLVDEEIRYFQKELPTLSNIVAEHSWGQLVFLPTTAWDTVRLNGMFMSQLSIKLVNDLNSFYQDVANANRCINLLVSTWFVDSSAVPSFEDKQKALHAQAIESLEYARIQATALQWAIFEENGKFNAKLQESNARTKPY